LTSWDVDPWTKRGGAKAQPGDYWSRLVHFVERHPNETRYLETTPLGHPLDAASQSLRDELSRRSAERVGAWIAAGEVRPASIEGAGAVVHGTFFHVLAEAPRRTRKAMLEQAREAVWRASRR
jgi:hypothetical protein